MDQNTLIKILHDVQNKQCSVEEAIIQLEGFPSQTIDHACIDHQRLMRTGIPEVIYGASKNPQQIISIITALLEKNSPIIATRISVDKAEKVADKLPQLTYHKSSLMLTYNTPLLDKTKYRGDTLVISAGTSDYQVANEAKCTLESFGHPVTLLNDVGVAGIHRILNKQALLRKASVIIVVAGMEGALPSVVGGLVSCPVIAVPTSVGYGASFGGIAALLGMLNSCAPGIAVVNIDNGFGAACMAESINRI